MPHLLSPVTLTALLAALVLALPPGLATADLVILRYHHIATDTPVTTSTSPVLFRDQLDRIAGLKLVSAVTALPKFTL